MAELVLGREPVHTVFDLLGRKENDLTYSLGWAFANVSAFLDSVLRDVFETDPSHVEEIILQKVDSGGITDVEVISTRAHLIIEAKRGWVLPTERQLGQYAPRLTATARPLKRLLALTECSNEFASRHLPGRVKGQKVGHRSWSEVIAHAQRATSGVGTHQERHLARQLVRYLKGVTTMQDPTSNIAYCVSLGPSYPEGWPVTPARGVGSRDLLPPLRGEVAKVPRELHGVPLGWADSGRLPRREHFGRGETPQDRS